MKNRFVVSLLFSLNISGIAVRAQNNSGTDSTGLPGDNFSLQGALQMFQNAAIHRGF